MIWCAEICIIGTGVAKHGVSIGGIGSILTDTADLFRDFHS